MSGADRPHAVVVGGAVMDVKARSGATLVMATSNPGTVTTSPGGVGRNIAENLARLGTPTRLVAAVGEDAFGEAIALGLRNAGIDTSGVVAGPHPTGTYLAVLDDDGDLAVAVSDMAATDALTVADLAPVTDALDEAAVLVLDGNLPAEVVAGLLDRAATGRVPVVIDPVSVAKAARLAPLLSPARPVLAITPNVDELAALLAAPVPDDRVAIDEAARALHDRGVEHVWVRRGVRGSVLNTSASSTSTAGLEAEPATVVDVTGAGDAMTAAFVHALLRGDDPADAARLGHRVAALTIASTHTVRPDLRQSLDSPQGVS